MFLASPCKKKGDGVNVLLKVHLWGRQRNYSLASPDLSGNLLIFTSPNIQEKYFLKDGDGLILKSPSLNTV